MLSPDVLQVTSVHSLALDHNKKILYHLQNSKDLHLVGKKKKSIYEIVMVQLQTLEVLFESNISKSSSFHLSLLFAYGYLSS